MMKKVINYLYSIITIFALFYGGILALVTLSSDWQLSLIYLVVFLVGFFMLIGYAIYLVVNNKKETNNIIDKKEE